MTDRSDFFVSPAELAEAFADPRLRIVDASWYMPNQNRDAGAEYVASRIPGAARFDIDVVADTSTDLPHMLPSAEVFGTAVGAMGISDADRIVIYDGAGLLSAPRAWWTFRLFGATDVKILEGGLPAWIAEGRPTESGAPKAVEPAVFHARLEAARVASLTDVVAVLAEGSATVVDARPADRFHGVAPEPRPGISSGHMPGALNAPAVNIVEDGRLTDDDGLREAFEDVDLDKPILTTCGSGVTASILWLAFEVLGVPRGRLCLYDGSWTEWASTPGAVIEKVER
ncbi:MAG: 3-mercaptopyruvate sulfurtransferase [Hyphomicrobiales bacterium]|nr:3-mercaptopyruvate sulfurtransferase [Hyphomicrobiales bacterium]